MKNELLKNLDFLAYLAGKYGNAVWESMDLDAVKAYIIELESNWYIESATTKEKIEYIERRDLDIEELYKEFQNETD